MEHTQQNEISEEEPATTKRNLSLFSYTIKREHMR